MRKSKFTLFIMLLGIILCPHSAAAKTIHHTPHKPHHVRHHGAAVDSGAGYADIVIDAESGRVIHATDPDSLRHPASLTKMMTLYLTFQAIEAGRLGLGQTMTVSENASYQSPSKLGLHAGQHIRVEDAILGVVTESANDAAVVLGETLGGSEDGFAQLMTKQAHALGMTRTQFYNPSGLPDPDQVTTAHDMAILGAALILHYPQYYGYFSHDDFTYAGIYHHNHNHLMDRYEGMDGIKTGYIRASGFNLVASAKRNGIRLIGVVFGGRSAVARDNHMAQLLDQSFATAVADDRAGRIAEANGEGDSSDNANDKDYVTLPAKVSAIFPSHNSTLQIAAAYPAARGSGTLQQQVDQLAEQSDMQADATSSVSAPVQAQPQTQILQIKPQQLPAQPTPQKVAMLTPPAAPPLAAALSKHAANWGIQIGAYSDPSIGQQALSDLIASMKDQLGAAAPEVQKVSAGGTVMYRARLMSLDKKTAQSVCSYLIQRGKSCLTVEP